MDTNRLKKFATEARTKLKAGIAAKIITLGFDKNGNVREENKPQLMQGGSLWNGQLQTEGFYYQWMFLYNRVQQKGVNEVYEEAAYIWFNRLMAIRILQKNDLCAPVLDFVDESRTPFIVDEARQGHLPQMKEDVRVRLLDLLDDDTKVTEQFAVLITAWCHDNPIINSCFESMGDYTELLLPNNVLTEDNFVDMINHTEFITDEDFKSPELIGWLYQFYISERKDEVFAKKGKFEADEIPAATQIFTPNWIVKYMVQNTVGRIYLDNNPYETQLQKKWQYLVEPSEKASADSILKYEELTDLKVADLACGSGHILNECFDLLYDLYIAEGYGRGEAVENIFANNLTGVDLDTRAKQLATFALLLKACQKDSSFADAHCLPNVLTMPKLWDEAKDGDVKGFLHHFFQGQESNEHANELKECFDLMQDADSLGSIMKFNLNDTTRLLLKQTVEYWEKEEFVPEPIKEQMPAMKLVLALTENYHALVMNPPYMGAGHMEEGMLNYVKEYYPLTANDLGAIFMDVAFDLIKINGKFGMINQAAWFFKPTYKDYRNHIVEDSLYNLENALYLGPNTFPELKGEVVQSVTFVSSKSAKHNSVFFLLKAGSTSEEKCKMFIERNCKSFTLGLNEFKQFSGCQFGFWLNKDVQKTFKDSPISIFGDAKQGLKTGNNPYFIKQWQEISKSKFNKKWFPVETGGNFRKWYGNGYTVLNWENDGFEIKNFKDENGKLRSRPQGLQFSFKKGITWSTSAGDNPSFRYSDERYLFESSGSKFFLKNSEGDLYTFCAYFNSYVVKSFIEMFSPGLGISEGAIKSLPFIESDKIKTSAARECVQIAKEDWDSHEISWDFQTNELLTIDEDVLFKNLEYKVEKYFKETGERICIDPAPPMPESIEWCYNTYCTKWERLFMQLHENEEELNLQFIDIYGLQDELTPEVPLDEITILQQGEVSIENNQLKWHADVVMKQLISYAVGCMLGRYRLDKPGLHIAHPSPLEEDIAPYMYKGVQYEIDDDGIMPLMPNDCGFSDNASLRLSEFIRTAFGEETQVENLNFIEQCLGKSVEQYFVKEFWKDHKKMYQNRPIYWLFSSKRGAFQVIAYMHRMDAYTVERIRAKYLLPYIENVQAKINDLEARAASLSTQENRQLQRLNVILEECREYHERLQVVAEQAIGFDLDDGVVVNYAKFGDIVAKIK